MKVVVSEAELSKIWKKVEHLSNKMFRRILLQTVKREVSKKLQRAKQEINLHFFPLLVRDFEGSRTISFARAQLCADSEKVLTAFLNDVKNSDLDGYFG